MKAFVLIRSNTVALLFFFQKDLVAICIMHHQVLHTDFMELSPLSQVSSLGNMKHKTVHSDILYVMMIILLHELMRERSGSVVECLTRD